VLGAETLDIILLGDIFEILKSRKWLERSTRPWEVSTPAHVDTVSSIFEEIVAVNARFFDDLDSLRREFPFVRVKYVIGNHDGPLTTAMGTHAAERLSKLLKSDWQTYESIPRTLVDPDHRVIATHGHEHDPQNRFVKNQITLARIPTLVF